MLVPTLKIPKLQVCDCLIDSLCDVIVSISIPSIGRCDVDRRGRRQGAEDCSQG